MSVSGLPMYLTSSPSPRSCSVTPYRVRAGQAGHHLHPVGRHGFDFGLQVLVAGQQPGRRPPHDERHLVEPLLFLRGVGVHEADPLGDIRVATAPDDGQPGRSSGLFLRRCPHADHAGEEHQRGADDNHAARQMSHRRPPVVQGLRHYTGQAPVAPTRVAGGGVTNSGPDGRSTRGPAPRQPRGRELVSPSMTAEHVRLEEDRLRQSHWKRWGPYLAERAWGTVREEVWRARRPSTGSGRPEFIEGRDSNAGLPSRSIAKRGSGWSDAKAGPPAEKARRRIRELRPHFSDSGLLIGCEIAVIQAGLSTPCIVRCPPETACSGPIRRQRR